MRRTWYIVLLVLALLGLFVSIFIFINQEKLIDRFIERQGQAILFDYDVLLPRQGMSLITVGTASPLPSGRAQSCYAVFVNGRFLLFDVGAGSAKKLEELRLPLDSLDGIFISQWQTDHYIDLPAVIQQSWLLGRQRKLDIYGPEPIQRVLTGMNAFLAPAVSHRENVYGKSIFDAEHAQPIIHNVLFNRDGSGIVYDREGVRVVAFKVKQNDDYSFLAYKISYNNRHIVIAGEASPSEMFVDMIRDVDLLAIETIQADFVERARKYQHSKGNTRAADILTVYAQNHLSTIQVAQLAHDADVKKLLLSHLAPPPENPISRRLFRIGMKDIYAGPIELAQDGDVILIP